MPRANHWTALNRIAKTIVTFDGSDTSAQLVRNSSRMRSAAVVRISSDISRSSSTADKSSAGFGPVRPKRAMKMGLIR